MKKKCYHLRVFHSSQFPLLVLFPDQLKVGFLLQDTADVPVDDPGVDVQVGQFVESREILAGGTHFRPKAVDELTRTRAKSN